MSLYPNQLILRVFPQRGIPVNFIALGGISVLFLVSCSIAPLTSTKTARTLGESHWEIDTEVLVPSSLSVYRGFSENFDAGLTIEAQFGLVIEVSGKYAFLNRPEGFSFSGFGGVFAGSGIGANSNGFRFGPIFSYKTGWWEPYFVASYNWVRWKGEEEDVESEDNSIIEFFDYDDVDINFSYMQFSLGSNFWFTKKFALNVNAKYLSSSSKKVKIKNFLPGLAFIWKL